MGREMAMERGRKRAGRKTRPTRERGRGRGDTHARRRSDKDDDTTKGMRNVTGRVLAENRARNHKLPRGM